MMHFEITKASAVIGENQSTLYNSIGFILALVDGFFKKMPIQKCVSGLINSPISEPPLRVVGLTPAPDISIPMLVENTCSFII